MKLSQVARVECTNGEIHLILKDFENHTGPIEGEKINEAAKIKKIMKEEALRPLFLTREY